MIGEQARASARITLRNLIAARWVLLALAGASVLVEWLAGDRLPWGLLPSSEYPLAIVLVLVAWALLNVGSMLALARDRASEGLAGAHLLIDALALTIVLALSGGPANPFTIFYFLPITLATQVSPRWTWVLAGVCVACFAGLFVLAPVEVAPVEVAPAEVAPADPHAEHAHHHHVEHHVDTPPPVTEVHVDDHDEHFAGHQRGMWVAFGLAGVLITVFVHRTALALARQRDELARLRQAGLEDRHLAALGTLAAGAAHELGTPLATIKLLADELPHMDASESAAAHATMREQLARCKLILSRMASPELRVSALGVGESWAVAELADEIESLELDVPLSLAAGEGLLVRRCRQPFEVLTQLVRELISNAAQACRRTGDASRGVDVRLGERDGRLHIDVVDHGVGMDAAALASAFDPFYSTRPEGQGMGLGLYLARAHLRQLGGSIRLTSAPGEGTTVHVELPLAGEATP
jgi:two-component system sensor histidine kinase RegB